MIGSGAAASEGGAARARQVAAVEVAYQRYRGLNEGSNYPLPVFEKVPPHYFGIALLPVEGEMVVAGDVEPMFAIQSISKVFTLALVLQESGPRELVENIGVDATGRAFDSIEAIEVHRGSGINPMVSAGAVSTVGMVKGANLDEVWAKILDIQSAFAGRRLSVNEEVYAAARQANQRIRVMSMLMSAYKRFAGEPSAIADLYSRQCAINVNTRDLAVMAATLAAGGRNPITGKQVIDAGLVPGILAIMATAGMYDRSGQWLFRTGLPAKSGIAGGLIAVAPSHFGIAAFSPPLDAVGNSVRAQRAIADVGVDLEANSFRVVP